MTAPDREAPSTSWSVWAWQAYRDGRLVEANPAAIREAALREAAEACIAVSVDPLTQVGREHAPWMKATAEDCARVILALIQKGPEK